MNDRNLRAVVETGNGGGTAETGGDNEVLAVGFKMPTAFPGEPALVRCVETAYKWQNNLTAVGMAGEDTVHIPILQTAVDEPAHRHMGHKERVVRGVLKIPKEGTFRLSGFIILCREAIAVNTAEADLLPLYGDIFVGRIQDDCTCSFVCGFQINVVIDLVYHIMVAHGHIDRCDLR